MVEACGSCGHVVTGTQNFCDVCGAAVEDADRFPWWRIAMRPRREGLWDVVMRSWEYQLKLLYYIWPFYLGMLLSAALLFVVWQRGLLNVYTVGLIAALPFVLNAVLYYVWLRPQAE